MLTINLQNSRRTLHVIIAELVHSDSAELSLKAIPKLCRTFCRITRGDPSADGRTIAESLPNFDKNQLDQIPPPTQYTYLSNNEITKTAAVKSKVLSTPQRFIHPPLKPHSKVIHIYYNNPRSQVIVVN